MSHRTDPEARRFELQSFGRRKGRKLSERQQALVDDLLPTLRIELPETGSLDLTAMFDRNAPAGTDKPRACWLEIGFGGGEHLIWQSAHNRDVNFIGCEPFLDGTVKVLDAIVAQELSNIRLYDDDARDLLRYLPTASIARAFVLFPDPWPKKKHRKRRLISKPTLDLLARVLQPEAELRIGTDIADYARVILLAIQRHPAFEWPVAGPDQWRQRPSDWPQTRYEQKAGREGRPCSYFSFKRREHLQE